MAPQESARGVSVQVLSMLKTIIGIFVGALLVAIFSGHVVARPGELKIGDEVRCETKHGEKIQGTVISSTDTSYTLELKHGGFLASHQHTSSLIVTESELKSLERLEGRRNHAVSGIMVGVIAGLAVGSSFDNSYVPLATIVSGAVGGLLGGAIGATISSEKWISIDVAARRNAREGLEVKTIATVRLAR